MSQWTHVNASIRYDGIPGMKLPNLGITCRYNDPIDVINSCDVPRGSEGSLQYSIKEYDTGIRWLRAQIYGDLRDYNNEREIVDYLNRCVQGQLIRDGVAIIQIEFIKDVVYVCNVTDEGAIWKRVYEERFC